jgi:hypothetical protein
MVYHLRRPKAGLDLQLVDGPIYSGGTVAVLLSLSPQESFQVRKGQVDLTCIETYWESVTVRIHERRGTRTETRTEMRTRQLVHLSKLFLDHTSLSTGVPYRYEISITLPNDAPPSVRGSTASICWYLEAFWDVVRALDIHQERDVVILTRPLVEVTGGTRESSSLTTAASMYEECTLSLSLPSAQVRTGEILEGTLCAQARQTLDISEVRVELECSERAGVKTTTTVESREVLQEGASLVANEVREWPFQLRVPEVLLPSITSIHETSVVWRVRGILSRRMRTDFSVEEVVQVYTAPAF